MRDVGAVLLQRQRSDLPAAPPAAATRGCLLALVAWGFTEGVLLLPPSRFLPRVVSLSLFLLTPVFPCLLLDSSPSFLAYIALVFRLVPISSSFRLSFVWVYSAFFNSMSFIHMFPF